MTSRRSDCAAVALWVAHASRVLVSASRRNNLCLNLVTFDDANSQEKFAIARTRWPARETHALPNPSARWRTASFGVEFGKIL